MATRPKTGGAFTSWDAWHGSALGGAAQLENDFTIAQISHLTALDGKICLAMGTETAAIAEWIATMVGSRGHVVVADPSAGLREDLANMTRLDHDLVKPPPIKRADFVFARAMLGDRSTHRERLRQLVDTLAPGGCLLVQERHLGASPADVLLHCRSTELAALYRMARRAAAERAMQAGVDLNWTSNIHAAMIQQDLVDVRTAIYAHSLTGFTTTAALPDPLLCWMGSSTSKGGAMCKLLAQLDQILPSKSLHVMPPPIYSTSGRRTGNAVARVQQSRL